MTDPLWKMIVPPDCAEAAVAQLPLMLDPELKMMVLLVSAKPPVLPPLKGLMVTLLVVTCAPVVVWTAVLPLRVVLGAIVHDPLASVTGATGDRASLSGRAVEQAAAGDQGKGRQQNF